MALTGRARLQPGERVVILGASGVVGQVALASARHLGAGRVVAVDLDPAAVEAATANAAANRVAGVVEVVEGDAGGAAGRALVGPFAVVAANVGAPLVEALAPTIGDVVRPGGAVVLSGMLAGREVAVPAHYRGATVVAVTTLDGWSALVLRASR
jgi:ribosomal protein L11 methyltransferase